MKNLTTLVFALALLSSCGKKQEKPLTLRGEAMGTTWTIEWSGGDSGGNLDAEIQEVLEKWESVLSPWRNNSDLSRLNNGEPASPELQRVIDLAEEIHKASAGAFDYRMLREESEAGFGPKGNGIDLSGIGKGFAVDRVGEILRQRGITDFVFELGGEVITGDGEWEVAIEKPDPATRETARTVKLKNRALATSGNYRQFQPAPGGLAGHILDPRTHKPIVRPPCSVSVIAKDCATADAWATALFVLGKEIADPPGLEVRWNDSQ